MLELDNNMLEVIQSLSYKDLKKFETIKAWNEIQSNKLYILADGFGSIYSDSGNSIGYFNFGSIISFKKGVSNEYVKANIYGNTFRVTQDSSFGNRGSQSVTMSQSSEGKIPLSISRFPQIIDLDQIRNHYVNS